MPGFLSPAWLAALPVLAIPLALHLWSRRPRHRVRLGSLRHLEGSPGPRAWGRRLEDLPLLLLRLALLTLVVLGLAGPWWQSGDQRSPQGATVVLAEPTLVADSLGFFSDPVVDSLRRAQTPIRLLAAGFPLLGAADPGPTGRLASSWSLLRSLADSLPPASQVVVIASGHAGDLGGARPVLRAAVRWHVPAGSDRRPAVVATWPVAGDSIGFLSEEREGWLVRRSVGLGSRRELEAGDGVERRVPILEGTSRLTNWSVAGGGVQVVIDKDDDRVGWVASAAFQAAYLTALGHPPRTAVLTPDEAASSIDSAAVVVWLSGQSVSRSVLDAVTGGATLVEFPIADSGTAIDATAIPTATSTPIPGMVPTAIRRMVGPLPGAPLWVTDDGAPLLTVEPLGAGRRFRLATRLGPDWSDLALGTAWPELAWQIMTLGTHPAEPAPVAASQATPGIAAPSGAAPTPRRPLRSAMLLFAAVLLVAERAIVHRQREVAG